MSLDTFFATHVAKAGEQPVRRPDHRCGACTLCCTVMRVAMEPPKPEYETCRHCTDGGCGIYAQRPEPCRGFQCLWLVSQTTPALAMPASLRPDRCGVAIDVNGAGSVMAHCAHPGSWRRDPIRSWLLAYAAKTAVILELPTGAELLSADGSTERLIKAGVHASGNRLYVRLSDAHLAEEMAG